MSYGFGQQAAHNQLSVIIAKITHKSKTVHKKKMHLLLVNICKHFVYVIANVYVDLLLWKIEMMQRIFETLIGLGKFVFTLKNKIYKFLKIGTIVN